MSKGLPVFIAGFPAGPLATNCYVIASGAGEACLVIDPGVDSQQQLEDILTQHHLHPVAVLLTHGHLDHTFAVVPVCQAKDIPAFIHPADRAQLTDPWRALGISPHTPLFGQLNFAEPAEVCEISDGQVLELAGISLQIRLTPGHTPGSVVFGLSTKDSPVLFAGDLLFAGSIGRVDLPGGSADAMVESLTRVILPSDDATVIYPGHGPTTTVGVERGSNPFLRHLADRFDASSSISGLTSASFRAASGNPPPRTTL